MSTMRKGGGGVAIFSKINFYGKVITNGSYSTSNIIDCLSIELELKKKKITVCCIYRPPNRNISEFTAQIELLLQKYRNKTVFFVGDMNINILNYSSHNDTNDFLNLMYSRGYYPLITKPTRLTRKTASLIDNIFTNELQYATKSGVFICDVSDHLPIFQICSYDDGSENEYKQKTNFI